MCNDTERNQHYKATDQLVLEHIRSYQENPSNETFLALTKEVSVVRRSLIKLLYWFWSSVEDLKQSIDEALVGAILRFNIEKTTVAVLPSLYKMTLKRLQPHIKAEIRWRKAVAISMPPTLVRQEEQVVEQLDTSRRSQSLEKSEREILYRRVAGETSVEIGKEMGLSACVVRKRLQRARERMVQGHQARVLRARKTEDHASS